jgi:hypothetical protein
MRLRVTGSEDDARAIINLLQSLDGIEHVEEVADLMPHMDDADSSSAGLSDLRSGGGRPRSRDRGAERLDRTQGARNGGGRWPSTWTSSPNSTRTKTERQSFDDVEHSGAIASLTCIACVVDFFFAQRNCSPTWRDQQDIAQLPVAPASLARISRGSRRLGR